LKFLPRKAFLGRGGPKGCRPQISKKGIMGLVHLMIMEPSSEYSVRGLNIISLNVINTNASLPCCCCHTPSSCSLKVLLLSWSVYLASLTSHLRSLVLLNGESQLLIFYLLLKLNQPLSYRAQCGGVSWTGASCCQTGNSCVFVNSYYYQCQTATATSSRVSHHFFVIMVITVD
jgi:hypothetical protein